MTGALTPEEIWGQWDAMISAATGVLHDRDAAAECAAEAVAQMLANPPQGVHNATAWMVAIAKRRAIDRLRRDIRLRRALARLRPEEVSAPDIAEAICARDHAARLASYARDTVPPHVYTILEHLADGRTVAQAAASAGVPLKTAERHLQHYRTLLRAAAARALAALVGVVITIRRGLLPATTAVAAAAFLALTLLPAPSPDRPPAAQGTSIRLLAPGPAPARGGRAPRAANPTNVYWPPHRRQVDPSTTSTVADTAKVATPVVLIRSYQRNDGYQAHGPVDRVEHCLNTLVVSPAYTGCN